MSSGAAYSVQSSVEEISLTEGNSRPAKKSYHPPELRVYGDIREITQTVNRVGTIVDTNFPPTSRMKTG